MHITGDRCKKYQCMLCNFETEYLANIQTHFMRHSNTRPYSCQNCGHTSRTKSSLKTHTLHSCGKQKFTGIGEYQCGLCEYATPDKCHLQRHIRCHTGYRPFSCNQCKYRCAENDNLKMHKRTHANREKSFTCEQCNCKYLTKGSLTFHVKTKHSKV